MIINAGIRRVVCTERYTQEMAVDLLAEAGVELVQWAPGTRQLTPVEMGRGGQ